MAARAGHAARIDFAPLRMRHVPVPPDWRFVVAAHGRARREVWGGTEHVQPPPGGVRAGAASGVGGGREAACHARSVIGAIPRCWPRWTPTRRSTSGTRCFPRTLLKRFRHVVTEARRVGGRAGRAPDGGRDGASARSWTRRTAACARDYNVSSRGAGRARGAGQGRRRGRGPPDRRGVRWVHRGPDDALHGRRGDRGAGVRVLRAPGIGHGAWTTASSSRCRRRGRYRSRSSACWAV